MTLPLHRHSPPRHATPPQAQAPLSERLAVPVLITMAILAFLFAAFVAGCRGPAEAYVSADALTFAEVAPWYEAGVSAWYDDQLAVATDDAAREKLAKAKARALRVSDAWAFRLAAAKAPARAGWHVRIAPGSVTATPIFDETSLRGVASPFSVAGDGVAPRRRVVVRGHGFPENVAVLVDASDSMRCDGGARYALARREVAAIVRDASDGSRVRLYVFAADLAEEPHGWIALPNAGAVEEALAWLGGRWVDDIRTNLAEAAEVVLVLDTAPLGVVIVTDELVSADAGARIIAANAKREAPAVVGVLGVLPADSNGKLGRTVASMAGGGYVRLDAAKEKPCSPATR